MKRRCSFLLANVSEFRAEDKMTVFGLKDLVDLTEDYRQDEVEFLQLLRAIAVREPERMVEAIDQRLEAILGEDD